MTKTATIVVSKKLKAELVKFKQYPRETFGEVIERVIHIVREKNESLSRGKQVLGQRH